MNEWTSEWFKSGKSKIASPIGFYNVVLSEVRLGSVRKDKEFKY